MASLNLGTLTVFMAGSEQGRVQDSLLSGGARPKGQRPKAGAGFLERGSNPPPHQLGDLRERCELSSVVRSGAATAQKFSTIFAIKSGLS